MSLRCVVFGLGNNLTKCPRNDSLSFLTIWIAHHCVSFTTTSLPISKNSPVVAVKHTLYKEESTLLVNATLSRVWGEHIIKGKSLGLLFCIFFFEIN